MDISMFYVFYYIWNNNGIWCEFLFVVIGNKFVEFKFVVVIIVWVDFVVF